jgi:hypothetical protein
MFIAQLVQLDTFSNKAKNQPLLGYQNITVRPLSNRTLFELGGIVFPESNVAKTEFLQYNIYRNTTFRRDINF